MRRLLAACVLAVVIASCSSSGGDDTKTAATGSTSSSTSTSTTRPTTTTAPPAFGQPVAVGAMKVTLSDPKVAGDDFGPWVDVAVKVENPGPDQSGIDIAVVCKDASKEGSWIAGSTFDPNQTFARGSTTEGRIQLTLSDDERAGGPVPPCKSPAVVRVSTGSKADVPLPDAVVEQVNAKL